MSGDRLKRFDGYEQRLILFLDLLGFSEIIDETANSSRSLQDLLDAVDMLSDLGRNELDVGKRVTQFSDSIVVSYPVTEVSSVFYLVSDVALLIMNLANRGYLVRGAITHGSLIHTERHLVGPAMIHAYRMESTEARVPRVLIDPEILEFSKIHHALQNSAEEEVDYVASFMTEDVDGQFFFDYVSWHSVIEIAGGLSEMYGEYLENIGALVQQGLRSEDTRVQKKHLWLHALYVKSIDLILGESEDSNWQRENIKVVSTVKTLDRYEELAQRARAKIYIS